MNKRDLPVFRKDPSSPLIFYTTIILFLILAISLTYDWVYNKILAPITGIILYGGLMIWIGRKIRKKQIKSIFFNKVTFFLTFITIAAGLLALVQLLIYSLPAFLKNTFK